MLGPGLLREGLRDGVLGANMMGISAISSTRGVAVAAFLSSRACLLRGGEF